MLSYPQVLILYFALFSLMQVRERMADEKLKEQYEYLALFERYAKHLGDDMALRARNIWRQLCASNDSCEIIPPFKRYSPLYQVAGSPFRISTCIIPKNMSIVLTNIFCYIYMNLVGRTNDTVTSMRADSCSFRNQFGYFKQISRIFHGDPWTHFVLVREPAERFLSGFTFVCDSESYYAKFCEDCVGDVKCALRTAFEYSQRRAVGDFNADSYLFWHLSPQNWRCEFRDNVDNSKLVHYSSNKKDKLVNDLRELLSDANVHDSDIDVITSQIANGTTGHATNHLPQREEYSKQMQNDEFKRLLVKVYFWDYVLFNFPLPDVEI